MQPEHDIFDADGKLSHGIDAESGRADFGKERGLSLLIAHEIALDLAADNLGGPRSLAIVSGEPVEQQMRIASGAQPQTAGMTGLPLQHIAKGPGIDQSPGAQEPDAGA